MRFCLGFWKRLSFDVGSWLGLDLALPLGQQCWRCMLAVQAALRNWPKPPQPMGTKGGAATPEIEDGEIDVAGAKRCRSVRSAPCALLCFPFTGWSFSKNGQV